MSVDMLRSLAEARVKMVAKRDEIDAKLGEVKEKIKKIDEAAGALLSASGAQSVDTGAGTFFMRTVGGGFAVDDPLSFNAAFVDLVRGAETQTEAERLVGMLKPPGKDALTELCTAQDGSTVMFSGVVINPGLKQCSFRKKGEKQ